MRGACTPPRICRQETALVDAYDAEGWRGSAREKVRPLEEIRRAKEQIARCKTIIRDCVRYCDEAGKALRACACVPVCWWVRGKRGGMLLPPQTPSTP